MNFSSLPVRDSLVIKAVESIGDATLGTKEKDEHFINRSIHRILQFLVESWDIKEVQEKALKV